MAEVTKEVAAANTATSQNARRSLCAFGVSACAAPVFVPAAAGVFGSGGFAATPRGMNTRLSGSAMARCIAAQVKQLARQP
jgi:hypothetical protein